MKSGRSSRKIKKSKKSTPITVSSSSNIPALEKLLRSGRITIVFVFAEWCGACHKFSKDIWGPMSKENAIHNRIAVRDDMVGKTSLSKAKFDYLPSILVVDEKGDVQTFQTPEGKVTNAMPTPKSLEDMTRVVNVPVAAAPRNGMDPVKEVEGNNYENSNNQPHPFTPNVVNQDKPQTPSNYNYTNVIRTTPISTPIGTTYIPLEGQKGGSLLKSLEQFIKKASRVKIGRKTRRN